MMVEPSTLERKQISKCAFPHHTYGTLQKPTKSRSQDSRCHLELLSVEDRFRCNARTHS